MGFSVSPQTPVLCKRNCIRIFAVNTVKKECGDFLSVCQRRVGSGSLLLFCFFLEFYGRSHSPLSAASDEFLNERQLRYVCFMLCFSAHVALLPIVVTRRSVDRSCVTCTCMSLCIRHLPQGGVCGAHQGVARACRGAWGCDRL